MTADIRLARDVRTGNAQINAVATAADANHREAMLRQRDAQADMRSFRAENTGLHGNNKLFLGLLTLVVLLVTVATLVLVALKA